MNVSESRFLTRKHISSCSLFENWGHQQRLSMEPAPRHPRNRHARVRSGADFHRVFTLTSHNLGAPPLA